MPSEVWELWPVGFERYDQDAVVVYSMRSVNSSRISLTSVPALTRYDLTSTTRTMLDVADQPNVKLAFYNATVMAWLTVRPVVSGLIAVTYPWE
jgi:hypothetical protein